MQAHQFFTEESWDSFKQIFDAYMLEASKVLFLWAHLFVLIDVVRCLCEYIIT